MLLSRIFKATTSQTSKKNQKNNIFITSIEIYDDENFANLIKFDYILNQNIIIDKQFIEWRFDHRERNIIMIQWKSSNARIYKKINIKYYSSLYNKNTLLCLSNERVENQKQKRIYAYDRNNKSILQNATFVYFSIKKHSKNFFHSNTKKKRYVFDFYLNTKTKVSEMSFRTWETRITFKCIWNDSFKRVDLTILKNFFKAQTRYNE